MAYAVNQAEHMHKLAHYADKILRGGKAEDLPIEKLSKFYLVLDLKAPPTRSA